MRLLRPILLALTIATSTSAAHAQNACLKRADLVKYLGDKYGEFPAGRGLAGTSAMIEVYASESGTFSIVSTHVNGVSCIVGAGQNWEKLDPPPKKLTST
jgi:hypothetical protein